MNLAAKAQADAAALAAAYAYGLARNHGFVDGNKRVAWVVAGCFCGSMARGRIAHEHEPRAEAARYDPVSDRIVVELTNGCVFAFPPRLAEGLGGAAPDQLAQVEVLGAGGGLHWEALDVDLSVPGLMAGLLGSRAFMARQAGRTRSPAKTAAARVNGAKGGRPRRSVSG